MKKILKVVSVILVLAVALSVSALAAVELQGQSASKSKQLHDGVTVTNVTTPADSPYGMQKINVIEVDLSYRDLYFDVVYGKGTANGLRTVKSTMQDICDGDSGKTPIAGVNGDLWMVAYAHCRVEGSGTSYGGCSDAVAKKSVTVSRGFNMSDGEIYTTGHMVQETPFEGEFQSFGVTSDFIPILGTPYANVSITNTTKNSTTAADGINRLPANNALVLYSDKLMGGLNEFALDDAHEIVIEFDEDYTLCHGTDIKGKVVAIYDKNTSENPSLINEKQIVLTARGSRVSKISSFEIGDEIQITVSIHDKNGKDEMWQKVTECVGGHIQFVKGGVLTGQGPGSGYPAAIVGYNADGHLVMCTIDGRQSDYSIGASTANLAVLAKDLRLYDAFILDGGGSATAVMLDKDEYKVINRPSDKFEDGSYGSPRTVVNSLVVSVGPERGAQGEFEVVMPEEIDHDPTCISFPTSAHVDTVVTPLNQCTVSWEDGYMKLTANISSSPTDPYAMLSYNNIEQKISADEYKYIIYTYKLDENVSSTRYDFETFLMAGQTTTATGGKSRTVTLQKSDEFASVIMDLSRYPTIWSGTIIGLRLDFFSSCRDGDAVYIYSIAMAKTPEEAQAIAAAQAEKANAEPVETTLPETTAPETTVEPEASETPEESTSPEASSDEAPSTAPDKGEQSKDNTLYIVIAVICSAIVVFALVLVIIKIKRK